jgi:uncharacterized protein with ATP-grasp and redox domains
MTSEIGSFARRTIEERKPLIIDQILLDYDYTPSIRTELLCFQETLKHGHIQTLTEITSDREIWDKDLNPWVGNSWLEIPWFLAETYFYRKILEIVHYFQPGPWQGLDPYEKLKDKELQDSLDVFVENFHPDMQSKGFESFQKACFNALWGNRGDLSNLDVFESDMGAQHDRIVLNQTEPAYQYLEQKDNKIAYFFDNVGKELFFDLAFIDHLLESGLANSITCYLKNQPFFVSDVMPKDLIKAIEFLSTSGSFDAIALADRLLRRIQNKRIKMEAQPFFTTSHMYRYFPEVLQREVAAHDLVILKGDVNYRRLFGDRHWPPTTPVQEAAGYFPTSFLSLRTLKGEIILGVSLECIKSLEREAEEGWMVNGKRGMITFLQK